MFVAGAIGVVVVGAISHDNYSDHSNHSDYSDYSRYSDAYITSQIRQKEQEIERIQRQVQESIQEELKGLQQNAEIGPLLADDIENNNGSVNFDQLSQSAVEKLKKNLATEIEMDEKQLQEVEQIIQKINKMILTEKS